MAAYGVDTLDPRVSLRRVWVLLTRLPPQYRRPGEAWSVEAELTATLIDHIAYLTWVTLKANGATGAPFPRPFPRPPRGVARRPAAAPAAARPQLPEGEVKTGSWSEAGQLLAGIPGVVTHDG